MMVRKTPKSLADFVTLKMPSKTSMNKSTRRSFHDHQDKAVVSVAAVVSIKEAHAASMGSRATTVSRIGTNCLSICHHLSIHLASRRKIVSTTSTSHLSTEKWILKNMRSEQSMISREKSYERIYWMNPSKSSEFCKFKNNYNTSAV